MVWALPALALVALAISFPLTALLVRLGHRTGTLDSPGARGHVKTLRRVPNIGGVAIYVSVVGPMLVGLLLLYLVDEAAWRRWLPQVGEHLERVLRGADGHAASAHTALAILVAITALHAMGLIDDRRSLNPWIKLLVQTAAAIPLVVWFDVRLLEVLGPVPSVLITVTWLLVVTNAINFIDNMDGLAGGVAAIASALFMAAAVVNQQWFIAAVLALLIGAILGFMVFNFPPARIFMGDGGSLVVGFLLAVLTVRTTYWGGDRPVALGSAWYGVLMPLVVLAIPLYDFVTVSVIRLRQGRNPFVGDQQHFSHRLVQRGLSRRGAVIVIWAATAVTGIGGISLGRLSGWQAILVGVQTASVWLMFALFEHASRHAVSTETREP